MGSLSIGHWLIVLLVVALVFGTKKLKNIGSDLGSAVKGFKEGVKDGNSEEPAQAGTPPQVASQASVEKTTIDVEAKTKT